MKHGKRGWKPVMFPIPAPAPAPAPAHAAMSLPGIKPQSAWLLSTVLGAAELKFRRVAAALSPVEAALLMPGISGFEFSCCTAEISLLYQKFSIPRLPYYL